MTCVFLLYSEFVRKKRSKNKIDLKKWHKKTLRLRSHLYQNKWWNSLSHILVFRNQKQNLTSLREYPFKIEAYDFRMNVWVCCVCIEFVIVIVKGCVFVFR